MPSSLPSSALGINWWQTCGCIVAAKMEGDGPNRGKLHGFLGSAGASGAGWSLRGKSPSCFSAGQPLPFVAFGRRPNREHRRAARTPSNQVQMVAVRILAHQFDPSDFAWARAAAPKGPTAIPSRTCATCGDAAACRREGQLPPTSHFAPKRRAPCCRPARPMKSTAPSKSAASSRRASATSGPSCRSRRWRGGPSRSPASSSPRAARRTQPAAATCPTRRPSRRRGPRRPPPAALT